ncbi:hypothetical protein vBPpSSYP_109 [Pseudomonas phage vB_PpS_SYP]|nr:hypothetical protein vBPpSSYP_109 [Pseudomonas phage vB_PpS_SYP]
MAYRPLVKGDKVRVVDHGIYHGMDATVVMAENKLALVNVVGYDYKKHQSVEDEVYVLQKYLIVREDHTDIVYRHPFYSKTNSVDSQYPYDDEEEELEEACGECGCCKWHIAQNC